METKLVISGAEILQRWGAVPFHLREAMLSGDLVPIMILSGEKRTKEIDPCLYCAGEKELIKHNGKLVPLCEHGEFYAEYTNQNQRPTLYSFCPNDKDSPVNRYKRLMSATFLLKDLEAYEQASGMRRPEAEKNLSAVQQVEEEIPDSPEGYVQQLKSKRLDDAEIKDRLYSVGKKKWNLSWWKVHCIVEGLPYPPKGNKGAAYRDDYGHACLRQIKAWRNRL